MVKLKRGVYTPCKILTFTYRTNLELELVLDDDPHNIRDNHARASSSRLFHSPRVLQL